MGFEDTHRLFKFAKTPKLTVWGSEEADMCKRFLGNTEPNEYLFKRKWFTDPEGIYIRHDCLDNELVTWFALKSEE